MSHSIELGERGQVTFRRPQVTVYVTCFNYGRFVGEAIRSVLAQTHDSWELIIVNDGSTDESRDVIGYYAGAHPEKIRVIENPSNLGLRHCANQAIQVAHGDYVMRLDADDILDENALLVLAKYLDDHPDVGLVYPNYIYINEDGEFLGIENRKKVGVEAKVLDLPAHGACTMIRKRALKMLGGYEEKYGAQDGYELWLKMLHRLPIGNVTTPLFSYRKHATSLSQDESRIQVARRQIKRGLAFEQAGPLKPKVVAVIPAKNSYPDMTNLVLRPFAGRPLIDHTIDAAIASDLFDAIVVTTDDPLVVEHCKDLPKVLPLLRPSELAHAHVRLSQVLEDAVRRIENDHGIFADVVALLSVHSPLRTEDDIVEAVDTLFLHNVDNVISVYEDQDLHFVHGENGLEAINKGLRVRLRLEREALYVDNGAINVMWREVIREHDHYGKRIGHCVMSKENSFMIRSPFDAWLTESILRRRRRCLSDLLPVM